VVVCGERVRLTRQQRALLELLYASRGATVTYAEMYRRLWGAGFNAEQHRTNVHNLVWQLRRKVEADPARPALVVGEDGIGYRLVTTPPDVARRAPLAIGLIGRDGERDVVAALLRGADRRLVTLVGPPGVGKTSLALRVMEDVRDEFGDGAVWVGLDGVAEPGFVAPVVAQAVAQALKAPSRGGAATDALAAQLRERRLLLVLDTYEHLLRGAAWLGALLAECPGLRVLVTSRAPLRLRGEVQFPVSPLAVPAAGVAAPTRQEATEELARVPAVALFCERARDVRPGFTLDPENAPAVAEICARLDGLPLAIELAAARAKALSPRAVLERLEQRPLGLAAGGRDRPARHRSVRDAIAWSYDLLAGHERRLLRALAVFAGRFSMDDALAIAAAAATGVDGVDGVNGVDGVDSVDGADAHEALQALVDHSLVSAVAGAGEQRFALLRVVREFALARLGAAEAERLWSWYVLHFVREAEAMNRRLEAGGEARAALLDWFEREHDNVRQALRRAIERSDAEAAQRLCVALCWFWIDRGHVREGEDWARRALAAGETAPALRGAALEAVGLLASYFGQFGRGRSLYEQSLELAREAGDASTIAERLTDVGLAALNQRDLSAAGAYLKEALRMREREERWSCTAGLLGYLALVAQWQGDSARARSLHEQSLARWREIGTGWGIANALNGLGLFARDRGEYGAARRYFGESLELRRATGNGHAIASSLCHLALATLRDGGDVDVAEGTAGRVAAARGLLDEALLTARRHDHQTVAATALSGLGTVARVSGTYREATRCIEQAMAIERRMGNDAALGPLLGQLAAVALCEGEAGTALALVLRAWQRMAVTIDGSASADPGVLSLVEHAACALAGSGDTRGAVRLAAAAERARLAGGTVPYPEDRLLLDRWLAGARTALPRSVLQLEQTEGEHLTPAAALAQLLNAKGGHDAAATAVA
jgi:predicted ATPase